MGRTSEVGFDLSVHARPKKSRLKSGGMKMAYDQRGKEIAYKANGSSEEFVGESQG